MPPPIEAEAKYNPKRHNSFGVEYDLYEFGQRSQPIDITIVSHAYNHEAYLDDFFRGVTSQKTSYNYELLILDDASQDRTFDLLEKHAALCNFPVKIIRYVDNSNHHNVVTHLHIREHLTGRFFAFCEVDDYWVCEEKLDLQTKQLDSDPGLSWSITKAIRHDMSNGEDITMIDFDLSDQETMSSELALLAWGQLPTCTMLFRRKVYDVFVEHMRKESCKRIVEHHFVLIAIGLGGCAYIPTITGVYRYRRPESFTNAVIFNTSSKMDFYDDVSRSFAKIAIAMNNRLLSAATSKLVIWQNSQVIPHRYRHLFHDELLSSLSLYINTHQPVYIYGIGYIGSYIIENLSKLLNIHGVIDKNGGGAYKGYSVLALNQFASSVSQDNQPHILITPLGISSVIQESIASQTGLDNSFLYPLGDVLLDHLLEGPMAYCSDLIKGIDSSALAKLPTPASKGPIPPASQ